MWCNKQWATLLTHFKAYLLTTSADNMKTMLVCMCGVLQLTAARLVIDHTVQQVTGHEGSGDKPQVRVHALSLGYQRHSLGVSTWCGCSAVA